MARRWVMISGDAPLERQEFDPAEPGSGEVVVEISGCGVCHTDLHIVEGDLPLHRQPVIVGHQIVGVVDAVGPDVKDPAIGDSRRGCAASGEEEQSRQTVEPVG